MTWMHLMCKFLLQWLLTIALLSGNLQAFRNTNHTLIDQINSMKSTWTAGPNPTNLPWKPQSIWREVESDLPFMNPRSVPPSFDARNRWPECVSIGSSINQGECSSCWAVATASIISDRICIDRRATTRVQISGEDLLTCCPKCLREHHTCQGGSINEAFKHYDTEGIVSGGEVGTQQGCKPYSANSFGGKHEPCQKKCTNLQYAQSYDADKYFGTGYRVKPEEALVQEEIYKNGPVLANLAIYEDFMEYKSGVYHHMTGEFREYHYVKIIGWGVDKEINYWLVVNSWGKEWGDKGLVKILRGVDHSGILDLVFGCSPKFNSYGHREFAHGKHSGGSALQLIFGKFACVVMVILFLYM